MKYLRYAALTLSVFLMAACNPKDEPQPEKNEPDTKYVGQAVLNGSTCQCCQKEYVTEMSQLLI